MKEPEEKTNEIAVLHVDLSSTDGYKGAQEKQIKLVAEHPYVEITDPATYDVAKKNRTALRAGRFELQNGEKAIVATIKSKVKVFTESVKQLTVDFIAITLAAEQKQQAEVDRYENKKQLEKEEKERIEKERIDDLVAVIDKFRNETTEQINEADTFTIDNISVVIDEFNPDVAEFNITLAEVKGRLREAVVAKSTLLDEQHREAMEKQRLAAENERLAIENLEKELQMERFSQLLALGMSQPEQHGDLGKMSKEDYNEIKLQQTEIFDKAQERIKEKAVIGDQRSKALAAYDIVMESKMCAEMPSDVWDIYLDSKKEAYEKVVIVPLPPLPEPPPPRQVHSSPAPNPDPNKADKVKANLLVNSLKIAYDPSVKYSNAKFDRLIGNFIKEVDTIIHVYKAFINNL